MASWPRPHPFCSTIINDLVVDKFLAPILELRGKGLKHQDCQICRSGVGGEEHHKEKHKEVVLLSIPFLERPGSNTNPKGQELWDPGNETDCEVSAGTSQTVY